MTAPRQRYRQLAATPAVRFSEEQFQRWVVQFAQLNSWIAFHPYDSRRSEAGWPDLVLARGDVLLFRELKTEKGVVSEAQQRWLDALAHAGQDAAVWRPSDEKVIEEALRRPGREGKR